MIQVQMEPTLHDELVAALYAVPMLQTRAGRDSFLISIPSHESWHRPDGNHEVDLKIIVGYLKDTFLGDTEEVALHHQLFVDQINYLIEQFKRLIDWISKDNEISITFSYLIKTAIGKRYKIAGEVLKK